MPFSLETLSPESLKAEARALREEAALAGRTLTHSQALEETAHAHGYRDWNSVLGSLKVRTGSPVALGDRVSGRYLKQAFTGTVTALAMTPAGRYTRLRIRFDEPVDVVTFDSFSAYRSQISAQVDAYGRSPEHTSDGEPHLVLDLDHARRRVTKS